LTIVKSYFKALSSAVAALICSAGVMAAASTESDADALRLEGAASESAGLAQTGPRLFIEGSVGNASQRYLPDSQNIRRVTLDFSFNARLNDRLRFVFSDRIDNLYPRPAGSDSTVNSLREAYVTWQSPERDTIVEAGRINMRYGVAYGYNPTDFFRDGSLRTLTTANPFALRDNRLGTAMLRVQRLWEGGSLSVAYSPKLASSPSRDGWSLDLGSTNNRDRLLVNLGTQFSPSFNTQWMVYKDSGESAALGASMTALVSDAATLHGEWTYGKERSLLARSASLPLAKSAENRLAAGFTYTTLGKLSFTAEYQYNGFGLAKRDWNNLALVAPMGQVAYLVEAQRLQELAPRSAFLLYVSQKDIGVKDLDLTAFVRVNALDNSKLMWFELRRHWTKFDLAFQFQQHVGRPGSEFGILPDRRVWQVLGTYYY
jgi:hypothetical protein